MSTPHEPQRIRVLVCIYDLRVGGAETSLLAELSRLAPLGIDAKVLCMGDDRTLLPGFVAAGIEVTWADRSSRGAMARSLWRRLRAGDIDLVHTVLFYPDVIVRPLARLARLPIVTSLTNEYYGPEHRSHSKFGAIGVAGAHLLDMVTSRGVRRFHAISTRVATVMGRRLRLPANRTEVIYRGRDLQALGRRNLERRTAVRQAMGVGDAFVVLSVGRQDLQKAHEIAVAAFAGMDDQHAQLWLAGRPGGNTDAVNAMIASRQVGDRVHVLGERTDVADLLAAADVFLMPSRFEGLGGAAIEAMALETPMVVTDLGIFREVTANHALFANRNDVAGFTNQLNRVRNGQYDSQWLTENRSRAEKSFAIEVVVASLARFYRDALNGVR